MRAVVPLAHEVAQERHARGDRQAGGRPLEAVEHEAAQGIAIIEKHPAIEGRTMTMILAPSSK